MCYAKPGPRCVGHTRPLRDQAEATMVAARLAYEEHPTPENDDALEKSMVAFATADRNYREAWFVSPERIRSLRDEAVVAAQNNDFEYLAALTKQADEIEQWRDQQIARSKQATASRAVFKERHNRDWTGSPEDHEDLAHTALENEQAVRRFNLWFEPSSVDAQQKEDGTTTLTILMNGSDGGYDSGQPEIARANEGLGDFEEIAKAVNREIDRHHANFWSEPKKVAARERVASAILTEVSNMEGRSLTDVAANTNVRFERAPYEDVQDHHIIEFLYREDDEDENY